MRKNVLTPYHIITDADMSVPIVSSVTNIQFLDNVSIQLVFTGTPTGIFTVSGSLDYNPSTGTGSFTALTLDPNPATAGAPNSILIDMNQLSFPYIRVSYAVTSGSGTLNAYISGKMV